MKLTELVKATANQDVGYVRGRNEERAEWLSVIDKMLNEIDSVLECAALTDKEILRFEGEQNVLEELKTRMAAKPEG